MPEPPRKRGSRLRWLLMLLVGVPIVGLIAFLLVPRDPEPRTDWLDSLAPGFQIAFHVNQTPVIDGSSEDWPDIQEHVSERLVFGSGDPEVTARWRLLWNETALFVMARVEDPQVFQRRHDDPEKLFQGDSVSFEFSPDGGRRSADDRVRPDESYIMLGPEDGGDRGPLAAVNPGPNLEFGPGGEEKEIEVVSQLTENGYNIEAAIPWDLLGVEPGIGMPLRMNLNVSDTVAGGDLQSMRSNNPDRSAENQPVPAIWWHTLLWDDVATPPVDMPTVFGDPAVDALEALEEVGFATSTAEVCTNVMGAGLARQVTITDTEPEGMIVDNGHLIPLLPEGADLTVKESTGPCE